MPGAAEVPTEDEETAEVNAIELLVAGPVALALASVATVLVLVKAEFVFVAFALPAAARVGVVIALGSFVEGVVVVRVAVSKLGE